MSRTNPMLEWTWKLLLIGLLAYAILGVYVYFMQSGMLYYPNMPGRSLEATPEDIGLDYQIIELTTEDHIKLNGWFIPGIASRGTVLFFHGNAGNISHRLQSIELFHRIGLDVFIIDYRGYGQSEGKTTERGTYRDAEAAWRYLVDKRGIKAKEIIVFGRSLGGSIAAWLASHHTPAALIVESSFTSVPAMGQRFYPFLPIRWISRFQYNTEQTVKRITCPILIVHSRNDEIIPYEEGRRLFSAASEPKQFLELRGGHNDAFVASGSTYELGVRSFIEDNMHQSKLSR